MRRALCPLSWVILLDLWLPLPFIHWVSEDGEWMAKGWCGILLQTHFPVINVVVRLIHIKRGLRFTMVSAISCFSVTDDCVLLRFRARHKLPFRGSPLYRDRMSEKFALPLVSILLLFIDFHAIISSFSLHRLNMPHDDDMKCNQIYGNQKKEHFIMSRMLGKNTHPWAWSNCSRHFATEYLE